MPRAPPRFGSGLAVVQLLLTSLVSALGLGKRWDQCPGFGSYSWLSLAPIVPTLFASQTALQRAVECAPYWHIVGLCFQLIIGAGFVWLSVLQNTACYEQIKNDGWWWVCLGLFQLKHVIIAFMNTHHFVQCDWQQLSRLEEEYEPILEQVEQEVVTVLEKQQQQKLSGAETTTTAATKEKHILEKRTHKKN